MGGFAAGHAGRPELATATATLSATSGFMTLISASMVVGAVFSSGSSWISVAAAFLAVIQVTSAILQIVGSARLAVGAGRKVLIGGFVLQFLTCAVYALYALTVVARNPQDAPEMVVVFLCVAGGFAAAAACCLYFALSPSITAFLSVRKASGGTGTRRGVPSGGSA